jgi:TRAP-type C4-dicarboxylate transport system permease large subunit
MTPPVGMNLFIASYRFKKPITELYSASLPFMVILLIALLLITYWPWLSLGFL